MDPARRAELTKLAFEPFEASREEGWNFLCDPNTERENICFGYYRLGDFEEPEYLLEDYTPLRALDLPWTDGRLREIESGEAKPNDNELHQWRQALAQDWYASEVFRWLAFMVPIRKGGEHTGAFALWVDRTENPGDPEPPIFRGVFDNVDEATAVLRAEGYIV